MYRARAFTARETREDVRGGAVSVARMEKGGTQCLQ